MSSWYETVRMESPRIDGFGACMIAGQPHLPEESFMFCFRELLEADLKAPVAHSTLSLGGFPISRAARHLNRAVARHPDFLVVQFGSTDITVSLKHSLLSRLGHQFRIRIKQTGGVSKSKVRSQTEPFRSTFARRSFEVLKAAFCRILSLEPVYGGAAIYREAMEEICRGAQSAGAIPILLAPFPHGDRVSDSWAARFRDILEEIARNHDCIFVDTYKGLLHIPKEKLLLADKLHLSLLGHRLAGELIYEAAGVRIVKNAVHKLTPEPAVLMAA